MVGSLHYVLVGLATAFLGLSNLQQSVVGGSDGCLQLFWSFLLHVLWAFLRYWHVSSSGKCPSQMSIGKLTWWRRVLSCHMGQCFGAGVMADASDSRQHDLVVVILAENGTNVYYTLNIFKWSTAWCVFYFFDTDSKWHVFLFPSDNRKNKCRMAEVHQPILDQKRRWIPCCEESTLADGDFGVVTVGGSWEACCGDASTKSFDNNKIISFKKSAFWRNYGFDPNFQSFPSIFPWNFGWSAAGLIIPRYRAQLAPSHILRASAGYWEKGIEGNEGTGKLQQTRVCVACLISLYFIHIPAWIYLFDPFFLLWVFLQFILPYCNHCMMFLCQVT